MNKLNQNIRKIYNAFKNEPIEVILRNILTKVGISKYIPKFLSEFQETYGLTYERFEILSHISVFNAFYYKTYYEDLGQFNKEELLKHWIKYGYKEKRIASPIFDINFYLDVYKDVHKYSAGDNFRTIAHWVNHGIKEERLGSFLFDQKYYGAKNKDVQRYVNGNQNLYFKHWLNYGIKENRDSSPFLSINQYFQNNNWNTDKRSNLKILANLYKDWVNQNVNFTDSIVFQNWPSDGVNDLYKVNYNRAKNYLIDNYDYFKKHYTKEYISINGQCNYSPNKSNVLLIAHTVSDNIYGSEKSFLDVVSNIDQSRFNIYVCLPRYNKKYIDILSGKCHKIIHFPFKWWTYAREFNNSTINIFKLLFDEFDINLVHANTIMILDPIKAAGELNIPSIIHVREIISKDNALKKLFKLQAHEIVELIRSNADLLIVNSEATKEEFNLEDKTYLLYNTIDNSFYHNQQVKLKNSNLKVGMLSSNIPKKGIFDFVSLANEYYKIDPSVEFVLAGEESKWILDIKKDIAKGKIKANLQFPGYISDTKALFDKLHIIINFSHFAESFGRTVIEGMSRGTIPIVYNYGALSELFEDEIAGYKIDYKEWGQAIPLLKKLSNEFEVYHSLSEAAKMGSKKYGPENFNKQLNNIYNEVASKRINTHYSQEQYLSFNFEQYVEVVNSDPLLSHSKEKLRIAYFVYHFPVPSETFVINEIKYLIENGYEIKVYCKGSPYKNFKLNFDVDIHIIRDYIELAGLFLQHKINVAHSIFTYPTVTDYLWPACESAKIPFTFAAHAAGIFKYENISKNRIAEIVNSKYCLRVNVPGQFHKGFLMKQDVPENKIIINPQVINNEAYLGYSKSDYKKNRAVCSIGRFVEKKGYKYLINAAQLFERDGIVLNLYGYGELEEDYKKIINEHGLKNVFLKGGLKGTQEIIKVFENNDVFIQPSIRASNGDMDGIPTILIEAMSYGIPVFTTRISSIPELIQNNINGFYIEQASPKSIATQLTSYYEMSNLQIQTVVESAKEKVNSFFDIESIMRQNIRLWRGTSLDIVMVSYNNVVHLKEVLKRLVLFTNTKVNITIFDNYSEQETRDFLRKINTLYPNIDVIFNNENLFVGPGTNHAISNGSSEYIVYVCSKEGMVVKEGWEKCVYDNFDQNSDVGLAGTLGYSPTYLYGRDYPSGVLLFDKFRAKEYILKNPDKIMYHVQGGLFAMRRAMIEDIGGFSELVPHNYTDVEFTAYVENSKWEINSLPGVLALFNKTKPDLVSRLDESIFFAHPPQIENLSYINIIRNQNKCFCNICGKIQRMNFIVCTGCMSNPTDRAVYKYFASSIHSFRRLKAIYVNPSTCLLAYWNKSFQGRVTGFDDLIQLLQINKKIDNANQSFDLILLNNLTEDNLENEFLFSELFRCLSHKGEIIFTSKYLDSFRYLEKIKTVFKEFDFILVSKCNYASSTTSLENLGVYIFRYMI